MKICGPVEVSRLRNCPSTHPLIHASIYAFPLLMLVFSMPDYILYIYRALRITWRAKRMQFWRVELAGKLGIPQKSHYGACSHKHREAPWKKETWPLLGVKAHFLEKGHLRGIFIQPSPWRLPFFWDKFHYHPASEASLPLSPARVPPRWNCHSFGMTRVYGMWDPMGCGILWHYPKLHTKHLQEIQEGNG